MSVSLRIANPDKLEAAFKIGVSGRSTIRIGLRVTGPAAAYALVWEWGRVDINPGPKTQYGVNPAGETTVLTRTAPNGFIRINMPRYRDIVREELVKIQWRNVRASNFDNVVEWALTKAAARCADLIAETAPYDKGQLSSAIRAVNISAQGAEEPVTDKISFRMRIHK